MAMKTEVQIDSELQNARELRYQTWKALEEMGLAVFGDKGALL